MLTRINIFGIIKDHFGTLKNFDTHKTSFGDILLFFIIPIIIAFILTYKEYTFENQLSNLIAGISIFGGFLFNLLAIIYSQLESIEKKTENMHDDHLQNLKVRYIKEIHANISFCIILSIAIVLGLFLTTIDFPKPFKIVFKIIIGIDYFMMMLFALTMLMVINRIYILLKR
ncbi:MULTISPECIES: hypothetical protein [Flavobacterium]|uniref:hypothetical protein n=1 Tax=Flavobacterium TaxID=237 RepID=UPI0006FCAA24|nr:MULTISPECIES: hypothetical protein [Flavobacterium]KQS46646.1 hypothetical protein ASG38_12745 [Flavobacterium sp. Leaf359]MDQ7960747.1 hypothetical protein [Flavobacterium lindanitolerans]